MLCSPRLYLAHAPVGLSDKDAGVIPKSAHDRFQQTQTKVIAISHKSRENVRMNSCNSYHATASAMCLLGALLASHSPALLSAQPATASVAHGPAVPAEFRGCESARLCRFWIESLALPTESLLVVRPNGIVVAADDKTTAIGVRNRFNVLMSNMIHQYKTIELRDMRKLDNATYSATVIIDGVELSADPVVSDLMKQRVESR